MPTLSPLELRNKIFDAIKLSGWQAFPVSASAQQPYKLLLFPNDNEPGLALNVYIWNVTHGGKGRDPNEYRIQMHGKEIQQPPDYVSLLLGWWDDGSVFVGYDIEAHGGKLAKSPSAQVRIETLRDAAHGGMAAQTKDNEIVVAFRPELFVDYVLSHGSLHTFGKTEESITFLNEVMNPDRKADESLFEEVAEPRRVVARTINKKVRDVSFQRRVLTAYSNQCAFCGLQMRLVDAGHILPVASEGSTDDTHNGMCMCPLHHRAYDAGIITISDEYETLTSARRLRDLRDLGLDSGMDEFVGNLKAIIHVPPDKRDRPHRDFVRKANRLRGWET
jgi:putative restriction endonuclease